MLILLYFDWCGSRKELKEWVSRITEACKETDVEFTGLYGSMNKKWNHVGVFETDSYDEFLRMGKLVKRPSCMSHYITELLLKQKIQ